MKEFAIKTINIKQVENNGKVHVDLLKQELAVCEQTDHPHIVKVYDILEDSTNYYVVMELIEGGDLLGKLTADNAKEFI